MIPRPALRGLLLHALLALILAGQLGIGVHEYGHAPGEETDCAVCLVGAGKAKAATLAGGPALTPPVVVAPVVRYIPTNHPARTAAPCAQRAPPAVLS